jgi:hypothetical protein
MGVMRTILLGLIFLVTGCNTSYKVMRISSTEEGFLIQRIRNNSLDSDEKHSWTSLQFNVQVDKRSEETSYSIIIEYSAEKWLFIGPGISLIISVDGEEFSLGGSGSVANRTLESGLVLERAWYFLDKETLRKISFGNKANLKIIGNSSSKTFSLGAKNFNNLRRFYNEYVNIKEES